MTVCLNKIVLHKATTLINNPAFILNRPLQLTQRSRLGEWLLPVTCVPHSNSLLTKKAVPYFGYSFL